MIGLTRKKELGYFSKTEFKEIMSFIVIFPSEVLSLVLCFVLILPLHNNIGKRFGQIDEMCSL
jgi:hypothetical protein